ncbi:MAG: AAC(3) family N-acetyltransferase [Anaerolineae bacterium]|nr:AAC(3) family N-acetyltransferase [Anaerolineae bacterium]
MSEKDVIHADALPLTVDSLAEQFAACGLSAGQTVIVHTRMSALGWVAGGAQAIILALLRVLTPSGTLMMPAFSPDTCDPANWRNPPVPEHWVPIIRAHMPLYDPLTTPTWGVGQVAELFRRWPGVIRSACSDASFAALGPQAEYLTADHTSLERLFDDDSPIGKLYKLDGYVFMLGLDHSKNTSIHLAEYRANIPKRYITEGTAIMVNGVRQWMPYQFHDLDDSDFAALGDAYEAAHNIPRGRVGRSECRFVKQRPLVDFAVGWLEQHRTPRETDVR